MKSSSQPPITRLALIGHPVDHSLSPLIHDYWIRRYRLAGEYIALDVPAEKCAATLKKLVKDGYRGANITLPHKERIIKLCDKIDTLALSVGAVNTLSIRDSKIYGTNTDVFGFIENLKEQAPALDLASGPSVVLGAGGAARAAVYALFNAGAAHIQIVNRTHSTAQELAKHYNNPDRISTATWENRHEALRDAVLLVNTTSLGMAGQPPLELYLARLSDRAVVYDLVYKPLMTDLLVQARRRGNPVVTGLGMLLQQARPAFQSWFGILPDIETPLLLKMQAELKP
jgi:shikimate dehydrogenase